MDTNLALVLLLSPFIGFLFNVFFGKKAGKNTVGAVGTFSVMVSFAVTLYFFFQINQNRGRNINNGSLSNYLSLSYRN